MIYLDVTRASGSPYPMGVDRMARGIYHYLTTRREENIVPVRWDFVGRCYATLSPREMRFLTNALNRSSTPLLYRKWISVRDAWLDDLSRRRRRISAKPFLRDGDCLLIPDLCWDHRIHFWPELAAWPGQKIAIFHDAMPLNIPGMANSNDKLFAQYVCALGHLDRVICISQEVRDDLLRYWSKFGILAKETTVLPWPVPFNRERPLTSPNQDSRRIIYVSRLKMRKNHLVLLEACELLRRRRENVSLDLIGVAETVGDTVKIVGRAMKLAARGFPVRWRRYVSEAALAQAYRDCAFTVFPSRMEGFGLPIIESLWYGRPVICGRNGAIGEVAAAGGCYQIDDQNNPEELAQAIQRLLNDRELYQRLYREAEVRVFSDWNDYGRRLEELLLSPGALV